MIVDRQHRDLHDAAQEAVLSISMFYFLAMPSDAQKKLQHLAMHCGCSHVPWFSHEVRLRDEEQ